MFTAVGRVFQLFSSEDGDGLNVTNMLSLHVQYSPADHKLYVQLSVIYYCWVHFDPGSDAHECRTPVTMKCIAGRGYFVFSTIRTQNGRHYHLKHNNKQVRWRQSWLNQHPL